MTSTVTEQAPKPTFDDATAILSKAFPGYEARPQQVLMAKAIEAGIAAPWSSGSLPWALLVQAGCGTGKSFGLAIPAAQSGLRVVIATGTKALQAQLHDKDLAFLSEALPDFPAYALIKGRSNYLCAHKVAQNPEVPNLDALRAAIEDVDHVGDADALAADGVEIPGELWPLVSSTSNECPGARECPMASICKTELAKQRADKAGIIVTNQAYLAIDAALAEEMAGGEESSCSGPLLGKYDVLMIDEADQAEGYLRNALSHKLTQRGLYNLATGAERFVLDNDAQFDGKQLKESVALVNAINAFGSVLPKTDDERNPKAVPAGGEMPLAWFTANADQVTDLVRALDVIGDRIRRVADVEGSAKTRKLMLSKQAHNAAKALREAIRAEDGEMARFNTWERPEKAREDLWTVEFVPVVIGPRLQDMLWSKQRTVLTSATLTTGAGDFGYIKRNLGLEHAQTLDVGTPFDYPNQARIFVPDPSCPPPAPGNKEKNGAWKTYVISTSYQLVKASHGGALLLFTSREAMTEAHAVLAPKFERMGLTVFLQDGRTPTGKLAAAFRDDKDSVLFGLKSFFVGLDVPGDSLRLVIIDKLPFPQHTKPVFKARTAAEEKAGRDPFRHLSIPMMTLDLVQGFGRLIRSKSDRGVVAILDSRLTSKFYGPTILAGLPRCPIEVDQDKIETFFAGEPVAA